MGSDCVTAMPSKACNFQLLWSWNYNAWWRHQMETFSALLAICAGNSPVTGEFPTQRPVTRSFDVYFDLRPNKWLSEQSWGWWFETPSCSLWRHRNDPRTMRAIPWLLMQSCLPFCKIMCADYTICVYNLNFVCTIFLCHDNYTIL